MAETGSRSDRPKTCRNEPKNSPDTGPAADHPNLEPALSGTIPKCSTKMGGGQKTVKQAQSKSEKKQPSFHSLPLELC